ncbi:APC family permease [Vibrio sp. CK2-1]|uniref:APC family permease n=1 Tax=Vibrio sp. CK2-1 TaxID=2912249 RepID=UPI001F37EC5F|nr:APC family permease [Vibrio sp. CK2-1]MCF7354208.1 APC family permease [Vibrio sp. CK2-1]
MDMKEKKLGLFETVLFGVCTVLVIDTVAASAAAGPGGFVWWGIILLCFFLPYGLVTAELSTTFPQDGGIYDWVKRAFGRNWGARTAWIYWINFALWIPAVYYLFAVVFGQLIGVEFSPIEIAAISIVMSWVAVYLSLKPVADANWVSTAGAICKVTVMGTVGFAGIYHIATGNVSANPITLSDFVPDINTGLTLISVALFGLVGFEVVGGAAGALKNPSKDIPRATMLGGVLIAFFYLISSFGILAVIPMDEINPSAGLYESLAILFGTEGTLGLLVKALAVLFLFTLVSNIVNWSVGVNYVARYAALNNDMPASFKSENKHGVAKGAALWNGVVSTVVMIGYAVIATVGGNEDLFWNVFSLGAITLLLSYIIMFPAFLKLRQVDKTPRVYKMKGGNAVVRLACYVPTLFLVLGVVTFFWHPLDGVDSEFLAQVGTGVFIALVLGEWGIYRRNKSQVTELPSEQQVI